MVGYDGGQWSKDYESWGHKNNIDYSVYCKRSIFYFKSFICFCFIVTKYLSVLTVDWRFKPASPSAGKPLKMKRLSISLFITSHLSVSLQATSVKCLQLGKILYIWSNLQLRCAACFLGFWNKFKDNFFTGNCLNKNLLLSQVLSCGNCVWRCTCVHITV